MTLSSGETFIEPGPDDEVRIIIEMESQPLATFKSRLKAPSGMLNNAQRHQVLVYEAEVRESHQQLLEEMARHGIDLQPTREYVYIFNGLAASLKRGDVERIEGLPGVRAVYPDHQVQALLDESVPLIGAPEVWAMTDAGGVPVTGEGVRVAIIDTGIDYTHPDLGGCFGPGCKVVAGWDFVNHDPDPMDDHGHGTHVAGIVAAHGEVTGVAPDSILYALKILNNHGLGFDAEMLAALEYATDPDGNPATDDAVDVVNISISGAGDGVAVRQALDAAVDLGVVVVVAAGNDGPAYNTLNIWSVSGKVLAVGASDKSDHIADFSSRGPGMRLIRGQLIKPDLVAPGVDIASTYRRAAYASMSGTSMSAPHVAGSAALVKQLHPLWTPQMIKANLLNTARDLGANVYAQGSGRLQVDHAALAEALLRPASISLGLVDVDLPTWSETATLHITNVQEGSATYGLQADATLPPGVTVDLIPPEVELDAGSSATVTLQVTVENAALPMLDDDPFSYQSFITARSDEQTLRVPYSFHKGPLLELTLDQAPTWLMIHDQKTGFRHVLQVSEPSLSLMMPAGTYDVWVLYEWFFYTMLIRENVIVADRTSLDIHRREVKNNVTLAFRDKNGELITDQGMHFFVVNYLPSDNVYSYSGSSAWLPEYEWHLSDISPNYRWEFYVDAPSPEGDWYRLNGEFTGLTGDITLANDPAGFRRIDYQYHAPPWQSEVLMNLWMVFRLPTCLSEGRVGELSEILSAPFTKSVFYMPSGYTDPAGHFNLSFLEIRDPTTRDMLDVSPNVLVSEEGGVDVYMPVTGQPSFEFSGRTFHLGQSPPYWF
ncbi:MAG: S8 family serine peptidase, partial [Ardenticatenia bacterium]|nr:S8 family serine peptidase [Ardenticatenia bacterium]